MANSPDANSSGGSFGFTATGIDDLLATGGIGGKRQKEPLNVPNVLTVGAPSSLMPEPNQPAEQHGHEAVGLPDSQTSGIARSDEGINMGHASGSAFQPPLTKRRSTFQKLECIDFEHSRTKGL